METNAVYGKSWPLANGCVVEWLLESQLVPETV